MSDLEQVSTDIDLYTADSLFTDTVKKRIEELIGQGLQAIEAAERCGISPRRFENWLDVDDNFRNWISGCERGRNAKLKEEVLAEIRLIDDPDKKQRALMEYLKCIDKEFGEKHMKTESLEVTATLGPAGVEKVKARIRKAREVGND